MRIPKKIWAPIGVIATLVGAVKINPSTLRGSVASRSIC